MAHKDKATRNAYMRERYRKRLAAIHVALGGRCELCPSTENLHVDHKNGRGYVARKMSSDQRITKYEEDLKSGGLRLLCESCNCSSRNHPPGCKCGRSANQPHATPASPASVASPACEREPGSDDDKPLGEHHDQSS